MRARCQRIVLLAALLVWVSAPAFGFQPHRLAVGPTHFCLLSEIGKNADEWGKTGVRCWGTNGLGETNVPADLDFPNVLAAGKNYSCAIEHGRKVRCWGDKGAERTAFFADMSSPISIQAGYLDLCVVDIAKGMRCRPEDNADHVSQIQANAPNIGFTPIFSTGYAHACALDDRQQVHCWGGVADAPVEDSGFGTLMSFLSLNFSNVPKPPALLRDLSVGFRHVCGLLDNRMKCWGVGRRADEPIDTEIPLDNPTQVASALDNSCALTAEGTQCWGWKSDALNNFFQRFPYPIAIAAGKNYFQRHALGYCQADYGAVHCLWGDSQFPVAENLPTYQDLRSNFNFFTQLEDTIHRVDKYAYATRIQYLDSILKILADIPAYQEPSPGSGASAAQEPFLARLFVFDTLEPVFQNIHSAYFEREVLPRYAVAKIYYDQLAGRDGLKSFGRTPLVQRVAMETLHAAMAWSQGYVTDKTQFDMLVTAAGHVAHLAELHPTSTEMANLVTELKTLSPLVDQLSQESWTQGEGLLIKALINYLGEQ